ncbi:hypothetical protein V6N12_062328 [Hibiscus sabdariffa]|uniref:DUF4283 domain-containing protein n=1 Tax=Hibiscus sabdariffa TaxID=183260 RepID=A0ABR2F8J2_9ROSI
MISSKHIDDNTVVHAFQGIWKHDKIMSIKTVKANYYRINFPTEDIWNDILSRGHWTFKDDWLALAAFNPNYNIDDYTFFSMNVWVRIYGIPSILMDDDDIAHHTGNTLGAMIGTILKVDTRRIDLNMVDYLRIGIVLDVTKPQELNTRSKGSIRYLDGARSFEPKIPANVVDAESTNAPTNPVDATVPMGVVIETPLMDATAPLSNIPAMETKLAAATISPAPNVASANTPHVAGSMPDKVVVANSTNAPTTPVDANINVPMVAVFEPQSIVPFRSTMVPTTTSFGGKEDFIDFLANPIETTNVVPYLLDNVGLDVITTTIFLSHVRESLKMTCVSHSLQRHLC